jgi:hypothetical protein
VFFWLKTSCLIFSLKREWVWEVTDNLVKEAVLDAFPTLIPQNAPYAVLLVELFVLDNPPKLQYHFHG